MPVLANMDRSTLGQSTSRLSSSVSTRSMARLASSSFLSSTVTSSSLTRPTLSSSRKASTTLKRSTTTGLGLARKRILVLGDDSPKDLSISSAGSGSSTTGGKRKAGEDGGVAKKSRLYSPEPRRLASTSSRMHVKQTVIPSDRPGVPSTPVRKVTHVASSKPGARWVHPLAHTPNRIQGQLSPADEGNSMSSDEMLLGDSPVPRIDTRDTPQKSVWEFGSKSMRCKMEAKRERADADAATTKQGGWSDAEISMAMDEMDGGEDVDMATDFSAQSPVQQRTSPAVPAVQESNIPPLINPIFVVSTTPPHPPPTSRPPFSPSSPMFKPVQTGFPSSTARPPASTSTSSLAPPPAPYTIAASPRKGLSGVSRFGMAKKPTTTLPPLTSASSGPTTQSSISQYFSRPIAPVAKASRAPIPSSEDVDMTAPQPSLAAAPRPAPSSAQVGGMLPPSRIPLRTTKPPPSSTRAPAAPTSTAGSLKRSALGSLGVAAQPPMSRSTTSTTLAPSSNRPSQSTESSDQPIRRKPSYPSSLGSGPIARPRDRQISVPVPSHIIEPIHRDVPTSNPTSHASHPSTHTREPLRSVSAPAPRDNQPSTERQSLSLSTRREGWMDTSRSLHGLSEALERLKVKKDAPAVEPTRRPTLASSSARSSLAALAVEGQKENILLAKSTGAGTGGGSSRLSAVHKPRYSVTGGTSVSGAVVNNGAEGEAEGAGDKSLAAIVTSTSGMGCLKGVVAFVDVWTADGSDSSGIFADMLRSLGARVLSRPSDSCTHIIYKAGRPATLNWYRKQKQLDEEEPGCGFLPFIVGLSWVTRSKEAGKRLDEAKFVVEVADESVFSKRRKSMEPKSLAALSMSSSIGPGSIYSHPAASQSGVAEAKRKSLIYAPKVGSPLKKGHKHVGSDEELY